VGQLQRFNDRAEDRLNQQQKKIKETIKEQSTAFKGKNQHQICQDVLEVFDKIQERVNRGLNDKVQDSLNEGKKLLRKRTKIIKLADREHWVTVKEGLC